MYGMTNYGNLFSGEITKWVLEAYFIQYQYHMSIYYKYAPDETICFVFSYVDDDLYWYNYEALGKWFVGNPGNISHVNFLGYAHWFMSIRISQIRDP